MAAEVYIARQDTLLEVRAKVEAGAKETTLNTLGEKIGTPEDRTGETVFGKFKKDLNSTVGTPDEAPLNEIIQKSVYSMMCKVQALRPPKKIEKKKTFVSSEISFTDTANYSSVIDSFVIDEDTPVVYAKLVASIKSSVKDRAVGIVITSMFDSPTDYTTLGFAGNYTLRAYTGEVTAYSEIAHEGLLKSGVRYYVHILKRYLAEGDTAYCNSCYISYDNKVHETITIVDSDVYVTGGNSKIIGSFSFDDVKDGTPIVPKVYCSLKNTDTTNIYFFISEKYSTPQTRSVLIADESKIFGVYDTPTGFSVEKNTYTYFEIQSIKTIKPNTTYYVHILSDSSVREVHCNECYVMFDKSLAPNSPIASVQRGVAVIPANAALKIPISSVVPERCLVTLSGGGYSSSTATANTVSIGALVSSIETGFLTLRTSNSAQSVECSWEIVEYI